MRETLNAVLITSLVWMVICFGVHTITNISCGPHPVIGNSDKFIDGMEEKITVTLGWDKDAEHIEQHVWANDSRIIITRSKEDYLNKRRALSTFESEK